MTNIADDYDSRVAIEADEIPYHIGNYKEVIMFFALVVGGFCLLSGTGVPLGLGAAAYAFGIASYIIGMSQYHKTVLFTYLFRFKNREKQHWMLYWPVVLIEAATWPVSLLLIQVLSSIRGLFESNGRKKKK